MLTVTVAVLLTGLRELTKETADRNEDIFNKKQVLKSIESKLGEGVKVDDFSDEEILEIFDTQVSQFVVKIDGSEVPATEVMAEDIKMEKEVKKPEPEQKLPLYVYTNNSEKYYIVTVRGNGLWDAIWGYIALENDLNTIAGASFDHKGETPGLGAEIKDNSQFPGNFQGKKLYNSNGEYVSIKVKKGKAKATEIHAVDGISGATITCDGVTEMMVRGIQYYEPYLKKIKQ